MELPTPIAFPASVGAVMFNVTLVELLFRMSISATEGIEMLTFTLAVLCPAALKGAQNNCNMYSPHLIF
ncbi:hypothetical protein [Dyadobacter luticola]|uniref:hypothetical protein n=1 Tax=Dyadobacter luticola TaxID=1979387 RepID=UPI0014864FBF|nr:hypothetical protein [Dyadobacter luticola]